MLELGRRDARVVEVLGGLAAGHRVRHATTATSSKPTSRSPARATTTDGAVTDGQSACSTISSLAPSAIAGSCCSRSPRSRHSARTTTQRLHDRRRARHHERAGADQHRGARLLAARGRAAHHVRDRDRDGGPAAARLHALGVALRAVAGHGGVRGRHRHLFRAPARRRNGCKKRARACRPGSSPSSARSRPVFGEIFMFILSVAPGATAADGPPYDTTDLHTVMDWVVRPQLARVPGVTEVNMIGGHERQYVVAPRPGRAARVRPDARRSRRGARAQQRQRRRRLHRALRQPVSRARAGASRLARRASRDSRRDARRHADHRRRRRRGLDRQRSAHRRRDDERRGSRARHGVHADGREQPRRRARGGRRSSPRSTRRCPQGLQARSRLRPHDARRQNHRDGAHEPARRRPARRSPCCSRCSATCARRSSRRS